MEIIIWVICFPATVLSLRPPAMHQFPALVPTTSLHQPAPVLCFNRMTGFIAILSIHCTVMCLTTLYFLRFWILNFDVVTQINYLWFILLESRGLYLCDSNLSEFVWKSIWYYRALCVYYRFKHFQLTFLLVYCFAPRSYLTWEWEPLPLHQRVIFKSVKSRLLKWVAVDILGVHVT